MSNFPHPLQIPNDIHTFHKKRGIEIIRTVCQGIGFRIFVIILELLGVFFFNSSSLYLDALSSAMDVACSLFLILCVKLAQRPPDNNHPFGHGRYEPMGGFMLGIFLIILGSAMFFRQAMGFFEPQESHPISNWAWVFSAIAMAILEIAYRILIRASKKSRSPSLAADAYHYRVDSLSSLFATIALLFAAFWPQWGSMIDHSGAIVISLFMMGLGVVAALENFHQLMDKIPDTHFFDLVRQAAMQTSGVEGTEKIRIQRYGPDAHVDIDIEVDPSLKVDEAHRISQRVRLEIQKAWPSVRDVSVHIEPYYANDH